MGGPFVFENLRPLELADRAELEPLLLASPEQSCEFAFSNLFNWCGSYRTRWCLIDGLLCLWMESNDMLLLAEAGRPIRTEDCLAVSAEMRRHGYSGKLHHIRRETLERLPGLERYFQADVMPDEFGEYLYDVERLAHLPGELLSKKRNMIAQFKRAFPDSRLEVNDPVWIPAARQLTAEWFAAQESPDSVELRHEADALDRAFRHWSELGMDFLAAVCGEQLAAFSMLCPINSEVWGEPFEKADRRFKGASQFITSESARHLIGRAKLLNREQDLGIPGLRQAKRSYDPVLFLKNYVLTPWT